MKVYLAAIWQRREELREYRDQLVKAGHECTSRWLDSKLDDADYKKHWFDQAVQDTIDIDACDVFIVFTEEEGYLGRGGKDFETGLALGMHKPAARIGPVQHQFYTMLGYYGSWDEFMVNLTTDNLSVQYHYAVG